MNRFSFLGVILIVISGAISITSSLNGKSGLATKVTGRLYESDSFAGSITCKASLAAADCDYTATSNSGTTYGNPDTNDRLPDTSNNTTLY